MASKRQYVRQDNPFETEGTFQEANTASSNGRYFRGVTIIKSGLGNKRDKHFYTPEAMKEAVKNGLFNDLRAFVDHPTSIDEQVQPERSVRDLVGVYKNPRFVEAGNGGRVVADLHILEPHAWVAKGIRELANMGLGDKIGISILGSGETEPGKVQENGQEIEVQRVKKFRHLRSADIVTQAGAGGGFANLLESAREDLETDTMDVKQTLSKQIREAAEAGEFDKVDALTQQLSECGVDTAKEDAAEGDSKVEEAKDAKKTDKADAEDEEDKADGGADEDTEDEGNEDDNEPPAKKSKTKESAGAAKALHNAKAKSGSAVKNAGKKKPVGQKFGEADVEPTIETLLQEVAELRDQNAALQGQQKAASLKSHIARKLTESKIPEKVKAKLRGKLNLCESKDEVDAEVAFTEAMFDGIEGELSKFEEVEGAAGSTHSGDGGSTGFVSKLTEAVGKAGLVFKTKAAK